VHAVSRIALLAALTLGAGCGGTERPAAAIAPPNAAAPAPAVTAQPVANVVAKIADFEYTPRTLRIAKGTRVTWKNVDTANHTVTFAHGPGDLGNVSERGSRSIRFPRAGTFTYVCEYHPSMRGKVIVK
jgi:plastocyanin